MIRKETVTPDPEGFFELFKDDSDVPALPSDKGQQMRLDELGVSLHFCYPLKRLGTKAESGEPKLVDEKVRTLLMELGVNNVTVLDALPIDSDVFVQGELNCSRLVFGPLPITLGPLIEDVVIELEAYLIVTLHVQGTVTFTLTANLTGKTNGKIYADQIQDLEDAFFYAEQKFKVAGTPMSASAFFERLRSTVTTVLPDLSVMHPLTYVSVSIRRTTPPFQNARQYAIKHAYEMIAMLGEEADWRQAEKSTVREILAYGIQSKLDDLVVPQEFASVAFGGSPDPGEVEAFDKFGIFHQQVLDVQALAAWTAFVSIRKLLDAQIEACTVAVEKEYQRIIRETNQLLARYLRIKQGFANVDHIWRDSAFSQYANYDLELYTATTKAVRSESLDAVIETMRALTAQMADIVERRSELRTSLALQLVSLFLSGAAILDLVRLAGDAYDLNALSQLILGSTAWGIAVILILLVAFGRLHGFLAALGRLTDPPATS
jgi:hypothetical protein